ncbi:hypothetical protein EVAR_98076_1 [Eumeta japonica]|uniref:Uncharacterized protein n=1 Tax=Eumeta variegata TaxID=151549 RepID=A0A4C1WEJ7_EUMVA|nr:hypothetical protein EVAR_98076_1 [Eumeta japonica]
MISDTSRWPSAGQQLLADVVKDAVTTLLTDLNVLFEGKANPGGGIGVTTPPILGFCPSIVIESELVLTGPRMCDPLTRRLYPTLTDGSKRILQLLI